MNNEINKSTNIEGERLKLATKNFRTHKKNTCKLNNASKGEHFILMACKLQKKTQNIKQIFD